LRGVIPLSWLEIIVNESQLRNVLYRHGRLLVKVIKEFQDIQIVILLLPVFLYDLGEEHLADSDHTSPSSVTHIGASQLIRQLREA
jgi:hypothetical protein